MEERNNYKEELYYENEKSKKHWSDGLEYCFIDPRLIKIVEPIHLNATGVNFKNGLASFINENKDITTIAVRKLEKNSYALVVGLVNLIKARLFNLTKVKTVITDLTRDEFIEIHGIRKKNEKLKKYVIDSKSIFDVINIEDIFVPNKFTTSETSQEKLNKIREHYINSNQFDKPVVVKRNYLLVDGYARYEVAKELNVEQLLVKCYVK